MYDFHVTDGKGFYMKASGRDAHAAIVSVADWYGLDAARALAELTATPARPRR